MSSKLIDPVYAWASDLRLGAEHQTQHSHSDICGPVAGKGPGVSWSSEPLLIPHPQTYTMSLGSLSAMWPLTPVDRSTGGIVFRLYSSVMADESVRPKKHVLQFCQEHVSSCCFLASSGVNCRVTGNFPKSVILFLFLRDRLWQLQILHFCRVSQNLPWQFSLTRMYYSRLLLVLFWFEKMWQNLCFMFVA